MAYKEHKIERIYFRIGLVAQKANVKISYLRQIINTLALRKRGDRQRRYTQEEMDYLVEVCRLSRHYTKRELAIMIVNDKLYEKALYEKA